MEKPFASARETWRASIMQTGAIRGREFMRGAFAIPILLVGISVGSGSLIQADERCDLLIKGGRVVDGTAAPWYGADLAIRDGKIVGIGKLDRLSADRVIDVSGLYVAPGFIDMMGQTGAPFLKNPHAADNLLTQGVTTLNAGEGQSDAPLDATAAHVAGWRTMAQYLAALDKAGLPLNVVQTVGHTQVRRIVLGEIDRQADPRELERMKDLVREAMEAGAIGLSTALIYPPAVYASTEEIVALAHVAGEYGGTYFTHMRNEGDRLLEAIDEALSIGRSAGIPVHIFHLKAAGQANWPKMEQAIARIKAARAGGQQVTADIYPYIHNGLGLESFLHPRHSGHGLEALHRKLEDPAVRAGMRREMETLGGWENWYRHIGSDWDNVILGQIRARDYAGQVGRSLAQIARQAGKDPWDVFFAIVAAGANALPRSMSEANVIKALREDFTSFCTDMGPLGSSDALIHPRGAGAFPRILARYVRELGVLTLEQAIARMTSVAANDLKLYDRGRIAPGSAADLVVFDLTRVRDRSTFAEPTLTAEGIIHVLVNGRFVIDNGKTTPARPGRVLRRPGSTTAARSG
jgi:N-acyl-D-aspartate/D-glutamate deacylase